MDEFEHQKSTVKTTVSDQFDIARNLLDGMLIISREIARDTNEAGRTPVDIVCGIRAELLHHQPLEFFAVVQQPVEIKQSLIDYVLVHRPLELKNNRTVVLVEAECIYATAVNWPS